MELKTVVCNLGEQLYGIDINLVQGIEKEQKIIQIPNTAKYIKGIMNLRGEIIPIYSLRKKFGMEDNGDGGQFVIVCVDEMPLAIEVDGVGEIYQADDTTIFDAPKIVKSKDTKYIDKVINADGRIIIVIEIDNLLSDEEKNSIEGLIDSCS